MTLFPFIQYMASFTITPKERVPLCNVWRPGKKVTLCFWKYICLCNAIYEQAKNIFELLFNGPHYPCIITVFIVSWRTFLFVGLDTSVLMNLSVNSYLISTSNHRKMWTCGSPHFCHPKEEICHLIGPKIQYFVKMFIICFNLSWNPWLLCHVYLEIFYLVSKTLRFMITCKCDKEIWSSEMPYTCHPILSSFMHIESLTEKVDAIQSYFE